jgi:hypothetical protein
MLVEDSRQNEAQFSLVAPAPHSLHECISAREFCSAFEALIGMRTAQIADEFVLPTSERAIFLVGSHPLGMATSGSDIDLIVLISSEADLRRHRSGVESNTNQFLAFCSESSLVAASFVKLICGVAVEVQAVVTPAIERIRSRLRRRGPELTESEIMNLSRLSTGWLLWESPGYLQRSGVAVTDSALDVYCSTRYYVSALILRRKGLRACEIGDIPLAFHLGRASVEMAYLSYFASEGYSYLGAKWMAQIGRARGAAERVKRHPRLLEGVPMLFPSLQINLQAAAEYLRNASEFVASIRDLIEQKTLYRIAFNACPQIHSIRQE